MYDAITFGEVKFPENFIWGSGYAGHQVEGNNIYSDRWHSEQLGKYPEKSGMACNSYELYKEDIALAKSLGHQVFRTSVEWSRIEPQEGCFCKEAAEHYVKLFATIKESGMKAFCTLVHFSVPQWFEEKGAFRKKENIQYFERFAEYIVPLVAPYVDLWNVLNEFNLKDKEMKLNSVLFHARGYRVIKKYSDKPVSTAHALVQYMPLRPQDSWDKFMTEYKRMIDHEFFFHAIRTGELLYPETEGFYSEEIKGSADFWSINIYTRSMIDSRKKSAIGERYRHMTVKMQDMAEFYMREFYPECIISTLGGLHDKPIIITENGIACDDDKFRLLFFPLYLSALSEAIEQGADVIGYLHWSLLDNFEWGSYKPHFGLCAVDRDNFERTIKPSAYLYKEIIQNNGFNDELIRKHINDFPRLWRK